MSSPGKVSSCAALGWLVADAGVARAADLAAGPVPSGGSSLLTATVLVAGGLALLWFYFDERRRLRFEAVARGAAGETGRHEPTMEIDIELEGAVLVPPPLPPPDAELAAEPELEPAVDLESEPEIATAVDPMPARLAPPATPLPQRRPARPLPRISERLGAAPKPGSPALSRSGSAGALA